jgi:hypothetical protein
MADSIYYLLGEMKIMRKLTLFLLFSLLLLPGCISEYGKASTDAEPVPLAKLIQDPTRWDGKTVMVEGFFNYELEGDAIFLTNTDLKDRNLKKAVSLGLDNPELKIPYGQNDNNSWWRKVLVPLSLRSHIGELAVTTGKFSTSSFGGLYIGHIEVTKLKLK